MVEIEVMNAEKVAAVGGGGGGETSPEESYEEAMEELDGEQRHLVDMGLVKRIRMMLKAEYEREQKGEKDDDNNNNKYSRSHYEEIMDPQSAHTCWRYLVHKDYSVEEAFELMKAALVWRKENGADESRNSELIKEFWFYTPVAFTGKSHDHQDVMYVVGRNYRKPDAILKPIIKLFCSNVMFNWDRRHRHDLDQFVMVFDVSDTGYRNIDLEFMSWLVSVRDFLPARISQVHVVGIPLLVRPLVRLIISWLPEHFRRLVTCGSFEELVEANVDRDQLPPEAGGTAYEAYLGPLDAPWLKDSPVYQDTAMLKAIHDSLWFHVSDDRRNKMLALQQKLEDKKTKAL